MHQKVPSPRCQILNRKQNPPNSKGVKHFTPFEFLAISCQSLQFGKLEMEGICNLPEKRFMLDLFLNWNVQPLFYSQTYYFKGKKAPLS
jgi:hypothetical protein